MFAEPLGSSWSGLSNMNDANPFRAPQAKLGRPGSPTGSGDIDIGAAFSEAWTITMDNYALLLGSSLLCVVLAVLSGVTIVGFFFLVPTFIWGYYTLLLRTPEGTARIEDLFSGFQDYSRRTFPLLGVILVNGAVNTAVQAFADMAPEMLGELGGNLLGLIVSLAMFYVSIRWTFTFWLNIDQGTGVMESFSESWKLSKGKDLKLFFFLCACVLINIVGVLALLIGLLVTMPLTIVASVIIYRQAIGR